MQVREIIYSLDREELLIYNKIFIFTLHVHVYTILTWSLDVPNLFAISIFSMILKLVYFQRSSPSSMFFWGFLSSGKVPITCLMEKKFVWYNSCFNTRAKMMLHISNIHYKTSAYNTLIYMYIVLLLAIMTMYMYMNWPVTSGVEAGYVWNVSDQGIL